MKFSRASVFSAAFALWVFGGFTAPLQADFFEASPWTQETTYADKFSQKLGFGFLNTFTGWTAFFFEPRHDSNFFRGLGKGIFYTVSNTAGGMIHAVTSPIPIDVPLPHGGISYEYNR